MKDPYIDTCLCVTRLVNEWRKHGRIIIALDYDDTVFDFHGAGHTYEQVIALIKRCVKQGAYICIFTGSPPEKYPGVRAHMDALGIPIATINENPFPMPFGNHGKMYYNILLDDRAGLGQAVQTLTTALNILQEQPTNR